MNLLSLEEEKFKDVKVRGYKFKIRFMLPKDRLLVSQTRMGLQNGHSVEMMTNDEYIFLTNVAMIDICTEEMPDNFNQHESCLNWDDIDLINELAHEIREHTNDLQSRLKKNRPIVGSEQG